jgi:hypothetical protein
MREVLISIQPKWCKLICSGEKTVEVRKNRPNCELPFKCYIYCTKGKPTFTQSAFCDDISNGKVIGEFVCDRIIGTCPWRLKGETGWCAKRTGEEKNLPNNACLTLEEIEKYAGSRGGGIYGWHITDLVVYDEPRELRDFQLPCDHENDCGTCKRAIYCSSTRRFCRCDLEDGLKRPPQSWCYVESEDTEGEG